MLKTNLSLRKDLLLRNKNHENVKILNGYWLKTYTVFFGVFFMKRLYMFSISIHLISLPFLGIYCEAISLFWDGSRWRARRYITFWYCLTNKNCVNKNNSVLIKFIPINILKSGMRKKRFSERQINKFNSSWEGDPRIYENSIFPAYNPEKKITPWSL